MSIESKYNYRFSYLKSQQWASVRLEALVRENGKCQICGEESISNDAHHVWYPSDIYETTSAHLVVLCRDCHALIHDLFDCKTNDESIGRETWIKFRNAFEKWRLSKRPEIGLPEKTKHFRIAYEDLKQKFFALHREYQKLKSQKTT